MFFPFVLGFAVLAVKPGCRWIPLAFAGQNVSVMVFFGMDRFRWPFHCLIFLCAAFGLLWVVRVGAVRIGKITCLVLDKALARILHENQQ
jgi:hypothetical protein